MVTPNSRSIVMDNGDAYVACSDGLIRVNLNHIQSTGVTPILAIPFVEIDTDEKPRRLTDGETITIPAGTRRLNIYPYVLSYGLDDPKVSYYLEGFDTGQIAAVLRIPQGTVKSRLHRGREQLRTICREEVFE